MCLKKAVFILKTTYSGKKPSTCFSQSDLYKVTVVSRPGEAQPFPQLFEAPQFASVQHPNIVPSIGGDVFANHTRTQLRS